ncbi:MAG: transposase [Anaerolineales bacterium]|nr:transposase [Anaerolineales bacterium]
MIRTFKYLLRPNPGQEMQLDFLLWQSRLLYNAALEQRITTYQETGKGVRYGAQWAHFRDLRHENPDMLGQLNASSLQHLLRRLDKSFTAFFRRLKAGDKPGFPRYKSRSRFKSIEYTYGDGCKLRQDAHGRKSLYVQRVGEIRLCYHRAIPETAQIKHAVIKRVGERWYACLMLEIAPRGNSQLPDPEKRVVQTGRQVGIDLGLKSLAALSTGELIENPRWLRKNLAKLRRLHRRASRQVRGSHRQRETYRHIARLHERIVNQRADYLHKISSRLVASNDLIAIENLSLDFMNRNRYLSLSSHDAGFGLLRQMLEYKAENAGIPVIAVNPSNTTQACSGCGSIVPKGLSVHVHECPVCGLILDRDVNAARNILSLALCRSVGSQPLGRSGQPITWAVAPCVD